MTRALSMIGSTAQHCMRCGCRQPKNIDVEAGFRPTVAWALRPFMSSWQSHARSERRASLRPLMRQDAHDLLDPGLPFLMGASLVRCSAFNDRQEFSVEPRDDSRHLLERRFLCRSLYD